MRQSSAVSWRNHAATALLAALSVTQSGCREPSTNSGTTLPALHANIDETSVSGISSGAYMAGQFQMAHAKRVTGAAIIAGGPYGCSESVFADAMPGTGTALLNLSKAINGCMLDLLSVWGVADPTELARKAESRAANDEIDPVSDVRNDRIYLFTGTADHTVSPSIVRHAAEFYEKLGVPSANIKLVSDVPAGHGFVTDGQGEACDRSDPPYILNCKYDQAGELLGFIYGKLQPPAPALSGDFVSFDQKPFGASGIDGGLADTGTVYVPKACREKSGCRVHIAFHGCAQNSDQIGDEFIEESGFARWADTNRLIILFPQVETDPINPQACWDWWGYTGPRYLTRDAPQIAAVNRMLDALQGSGGGA